MNRDTCIELSSSSSQESLDHPKQQQDVVEQPASTGEIEWKETNSRVNDEIEISGSKVAEDEEPGATVASASSVRRLKSATLDRMGRMLKIHSKSSGEKPDASTPTSASCNDDPTRKQKFNSLTRMLRLTDKDEGSGTKSKSLSQNHGRSLTRILRRKVPNEGDNIPDKPDEHIRGIFSRILGQIRGKCGRVSKADSTTENNFQKNKDKSSLSKSPSSSALSDLTLESSCPVMSTRHQA